jgi:hypothetical protein
MPMTAVDPPGAYIHPPRETSDIQLPSRETPDIISPPPAFNRQEPPPPSYQDFQKDVQIQPSSHS